jgi:hypothetical protein
MAGQDCLRKRTREETIGWTAHEPVWFMARDGSKTFGVVAEEVPPPPRVLKVYINTDPSGWCEEVSAVCLWPLFEDMVVGSEQAAWAFQEAKTRKAAADHNESLGEALARVQAEIAEIVREEA